MMSHLEDSLSDAGMSESEAAAKAKLFEPCRQALGGESADELHLFAPGRIEVLGKHTDYCGGRSLVAAVERGLCFVARPRSDAHIRITAAADGKKVEFPFSGEIEPRPGDWSNYFMTVARRLARNFPSPSLRGAEIAFAGDLPPAAGLSSSSALITAMTLLLMRINGIEDRPEYRSAIGSPWDLCGYLGTIENGRTFGPLVGDKGVGTFGGSQDHTAILCGRAGRLSRIAFNPVRLEREIPFPPDHCFIIAASGVLAEKTGSAMRHYNLASERVGRIMEIWQGKTGRNDATLAEAIRSGDKAFDLLLGILRQDPNGDELIDRATQFQRESEQIIPAAADALASGYLAEFGRQVDQSQQWTERLLRNQVPQTIHLAHSARRLGAAAASAFGAGFGGSVWALAPAATAGELLEAWRADYRQAYPAEAARATFFLTRPGPGAMFL